MLDLAPFTNKPTCKRHLQVAARVHRVVKEHLTNESGDQLPEQAGGLR